MLRPHRRRNPQSVTSIGNSAFSGCSGLTAVEIPNSVTSIGDRAFYGCTSLTSIEIPNFVTSIGNSAFYGCSGLATVEIPNSVTSIGYEAFYGCERLHSVTIGAGVLSIGSNAFVYRDGTLIIDRPEKVIWLCNTPPEGHDNAEGSVNYVANTSYNGLWNVKVYPYLSSLFEVGGIKYVPVSPSERTCDAIDCAYDATSDVRIGRTVNYQGIEMTVEDIRPYTCYDNDSVKALHLDGYVGNIGHSAFYDCNSLAGVTIPNTVDNLGDRCFYGCTALTQATINATGSLGESCFEGCTALTQADINVNGSLGASCFEGCTALTQADINVNGDLGSSCFQGCTALTQAILGDSITEIPSSCFEDCSALPEITIPAAVKRIDNNVFEGCTSLANVTIADRDSVLTLGYNKAYYSSEDGEPMFADCPLQTVYIGGNISYSTDASAGYSPFYRNTSLESVTITDKETEISENEFYGCTNLKNVTLGDGIETIGSYAFSGCAALTDFTFGSSLKSIGEEAFSDCTAMTRLVSRTAEPPVCGHQQVDVQALRARRVDRRLPIGRPVERVLLHHRHSPCRGRRRQCGRPHPFGPRAGVRPVGPASQRSPECKLYRRSIERAALRHLHPAGQRRRHESDPRISCSPTRRTSTCEHKPQQFVPGKKEKPFPGTFFAANPRRGDFQIARMTVKRHR